MWETDIREMSVSELTLDDLLTEGSDVTRPPGEGRDGDGVGRPGEGGLEQPVVEPLEPMEPMLMSTEAQTEGPAIRAGAGVPLWWL
jgi:hypothetical protein